MEGSTGPRLADQQSKCPPLVHKVTTGATNKRALLIGINTYLNAEIPNLGGCLNDVVLMNKLLMETFGFPAENIYQLHDETKDKPTREAIMTALYRLVASTQKDDLVVVFYAGHGSRRRNSAKPSGFSETIVPRDSGRPHKKNTTDKQYTANLDITDDELNHIMLRPLTARTSNLVLIFDSCHSGHILRELHSTVARFVETDESDLAIERPLVSQFESNYESSRTVKGSSGWLPMSDNYVLLAACQANEKANEKHIVFDDLPNATTLSHGTWTYELCRAILARTQAGNSGCVTYRDIFEHAFPLVTQAFHSQHPVIEGMLDKQVFGVHTVQTMPYAIVLAKKGGRLQLSCGAAHGCCTGSRFALYPKGTKDRKFNDDSDIICVVQISEVGSVTSWASAVEADFDLDDVEIGMPAFEITYSLNDLKIGVRVVIMPELITWTKSEPLKSMKIDQIEKFRLEIVKFIEGSALLFLVTTNDAEQDCVTVQLTSPTQTVQHLQYQSNGNPLYLVFSADGQLEIETKVEINENGTKQLKKCLQSLGQFHRVMKLNNDSHQNNPLKNQVDLQLLRRKNHKDPWEDVLCDKGLDKGLLLPKFLEDQCIGARIVNNGQLPVEIALLELAEDGSVVILYPANGVTERIEPGHMLVVGDDWNPISVPSSSRLYETFKLFVTTERTNFDMLTQESFRGQASSTLEELLFTDKMRLVGKKAVDKSYWTTVQKTIKLEKKKSDNFKMPGNLIRNSDVAVASGGGEIFDNVEDKGTKSIRHLLEQCFLQCWQENFRSITCILETKEEEDCLSMEHIYKKIGNIFQGETFFCNEEIENTFRDFLSTSLCTRENLISIYQMVRSIWKDDTSAEKFQCTELQTKLSFIGFTSLVPFLNPSLTIVQYAKTHYNIGLILSKQHNIIEANDAICHYNLALDVWNEEEYPLNHGQTLFLIANVHCDLIDLKISHSEKLQHANEAISLYMKAHAIFTVVEAIDDVCQVVYNLCVVLLQVGDIDLNHTFSKELDLVMVFIDDAIKTLKITPLTCISAGLLLDIITAQKQLTKHNVALPWQEHVIDICGELLKSGLIDDDQRMKCNRMMSDAFKSRLIGSHAKNLKTAAEYLFTVVEFCFEKQKHDEIDSRFLAECVVNLGGTVEELRCFYISPETKKYVERAKNYLQQIIHDESQDKDLKESAFYNLSRFADDNIEDLKKLLSVAVVENFSPALRGHLNADLARNLLSKSFPELDKSMFIVEKSDNESTGEDSKSSDAESTDDKNKAWDTESPDGQNMVCGSENPNDENKVWYMEIPDDENKVCAAESPDDENTSDAQQYYEVDKENMIYKKRISLKPSLNFGAARFSKFKCGGGSLCGHTEDVLRYLEEAEKLLLAEATMDTGYIKNFGIMGRYWATHCKLPDKEKLEYAWSVFFRTIKEIERLWPLYNVDAQVTFINEVGQLWEDALDVAMAQHDLHIESSSHRILAIFSSAKARNLFVALKRLQSYTDKEECLGSSTTPSATSLSVSITTAQLSKWSSDNYRTAASSVAQNLLDSFRADEVAVEWWMSVKQFIVCLAYSKLKEPQIFHVWNEEESSNLYQLCLEASNNAAFYSWEKSFIDRLSQALHLEKLAAFLTGVFPEATKLFLLPHVYLHSIPIHALPLFAGKSSCLLDNFPGGISFLPNIELLAILRQAKNSCAKVHTVLFQADPAGDLQYSRQEVENIHEVITASANTSDVFQKSTCKIFADNLSARQNSGNDENHSNSLLLHIACHGEWNEEDPAESYLQLEDEKFTMSNFKDIPLTNCRLATLSACKSGLRNFSRTHMTDIFIGFGVQFLAKGCENVMLTLSPVFDRTTAELMQNFYAEMFHKKISIASSLRNAQLSLRDGSVKTGVYPQSDKEAERLVGKKATIHSPNTRWFLAAPFILIGSGD